MNMLIDFIATMPFWYWWVLAVVLLVLELATGSTYLLWPSAAAVLTGFADLWPMDGMWRAQLALFAGVTVVLSLAAPRYVRPWLQKIRADHPALNERGMQTEGRRARAEGPFANGQGKVRVGDSVWLAELEAGDALDDGAQVLVVRAEGTKLIVRPAG